jgi:Spy/CpxP family protein refolding chaperone
MKEIQMKYPQRLLIGLALSLATATVVVAQGTAEPGSGPGMGHGPMRMGPNNTSGWGMMNKAERNEHHSMMKSMKTQEECSAYMEKHHAQMMDRAKERKLAIPTKPRDDTCLWLKK